MTASGLCDAAIDGLGGAEAGQVGKRLAETGEEVHVLSYCSSDKCNRADVNTLFECCDVADHVCV